MHRRLCLSGSHAGLEARDHHQVPVRRAGEDPGVRGVLEHEAVESRRGDTDDRERAAVNADRPAQHAGIALEPRAPPARADDGHFVIRRFRCSADERRHAKIAEEARRDLLHLAGWLRGAVDRHRRTVETREADNLGDNLVLSAHRFEHRRLEHVKRFLEASGQDGKGLDLYQAIRLAHRQRAQQQAVDEAEERGVGADAERKRERDDGGERRALPQPAERVAQVLGDDVHHGQAAVLAVRLAEPVGPAEFQERLAPRLGRGEPAPAELVRQQLEMRRQLFVELAIQPVPRDDRSQPRPQQGEQRGHCPDPPSASTRPITAATRSQFSVAAASCVSPGLVIV